MLLFSFIYTIDYDQLASYITIYSAHSVVSDFFGEGWGVISTERAMRNSIEATPRRRIG